MNIPNNPPSDSADLNGFYLTAKHYRHHALTIGEYTYGLPEISVERVGGRITIGKFCSLAQTAKIVIHAEHRHDWVSGYPFAQLKTDWPKAACINTDDSVPFKGDIVIGNDVWIGSNATILGGVTVGDGAIIGAHAVVAKDIPPYSIVVGNPARQIRRRFDYWTIERLLELSWWDWPIEKIQQNVDLLCSNNIEKLFNIKD